VDAYDHVSFVRTNLRPGTVWLGVEHVSFGVPLVNELRRSCPVPIRKLQPRGDKLARAMPAITWARAGRVHVSEAIDPERRAEFTGEIARFPYDAHDDQVDVLAYAVIAAMDHVHWEPVPTRNLSLEERVWERVRRRKRRGHHPVLGRWA
jgi:phage terminase large subunit-like protein